MHCEIYTCVIYCAPVTVIIVMHQNQIQYILPHYNQKLLGLLLLNLNKCLSSLPEAVTPL